MLIGNRNTEGDTTAPGDGPTKKLWRAPLAPGAIQHRMSLPGSKSLTNRELILAALADGPGVLRSPLISRDTSLMIDALVALGVRIEEIETGSPFGPDLHVTPATELLGSTSISCGLAGTVMRFMPPVAALALGPTSFDGDVAARRRPMRAILDALRTIGADIADDGRGTLPFTVHGTGGITGGRVEIDASLSSQFVSGLMLAAPRFEEGIHIVHTGERLPSIPHIDMTVNVLQSRGVVVERVAQAEWVVHPGPIKAMDVAIEPDLSNAAPFLAAAVVAGGTVAVDGWPTNTTQVGDTLRDLLQLFGAKVELENNVLTVSGSGKFSGIKLNLSDAGELAPTIVTLAALADSPSEIKGIGHIRHHETDRLAALVSEINKLGGDATELDDGIRIEPRKLHGGTWLSYEDHRMATSGALLGLVVPDVVVEDVETTSKTLPQFVQLWHEMLAK